MGKREEVKKPRQPRDWYGTVDPDAVEALKPFLHQTSSVWGQSAPLTRYIEPCAGDGSLIDLMHSRGLPVKCVAAYDIEPQRADITQRNCLTLRSKDITDAHCFITNPPFAWQMLEPILLHLPLLLPTWLLLPSDVMFNKRMSVHMKRCSDAVAVGRLWWFKNAQGKRVKGVDNFCWMRFDGYHEGKTNFYGRVN